MNYIMINESFLYELEIKVNKYIEMGYKPQGGVFEYGGCIHQAMIKD